MTRKGMINKLTESFSALLIETSTEQLYKVYPVVYESLLKKGLIQENKPVVNALYYGGKYVEEHSGGYLET